MKLYIVKYTANEFDALGYDSFYPIFYSLDENKARDFFENERNTNINHFNNFLKTHPEYIDNEDYEIADNEENYLKYYMGNWFYEYMFDEIELDKDLRYT